MGLKTQGKSGDQVLETTMSFEVIVLLTLTTLLFSLGFASGPYVARKLGRPARR